MQKLRELNKVKMIRVLQIEFYRDKESNIVLALHYNDENFEKNEDFAKQHFVRCDIKK